MTCDDDVRLRDVASRGGDALLRRGVPNEIGGYNRHLIAAERLTFVSGRHNATVEAAKLAKLFVKPS